MALAPAFTVPTWLARATVWWVLAASLKVRESSVACFKRASAALLSPAGSRCVAWWFRV